MFEQDINHHKNSDKDNFIRKYSSTEVTFKLTELFSTKDYQTTLECLMILDNQIDTHMLQVLQPKCQNIILVDGGANRFYNSKFRDSKKVRFIVGDFDGVKEQVRTYYHKKGIDIVHDPDQNNTDFEKTLNQSRKRGFKQLVFLNFYPGRIDHVLSAISMTQKDLRKSPQRHIVLIGKNSLMIYLHEQIDYTIKVKSERIQKAGCGMITFGKIREIETQGFKWNLGQKQYYKSIEWGNFLSTSNEFADQKVKISSTDPLFFVAQIKTQIKPQTTW